MALAGARLIEAARRLPRGLEPPVVAFCATPREAAAALEAGAAEVVEASFDGRVAARRAERLVRFAETLGELGRTRDEMARLQRSVEDERRETVLRGRFDGRAHLGNAHI